MTSRFPAMLRQRLFSSSTRTRAAIPAEMATFNTAASQLGAASPVPKLGRIGKWYLPTMALIAVGFAIENHLEAHNKKATATGSELTQEERNAMLMEAYGSRNSLEDMERALAGHGTAKPSGPQQKLAALNDAYGARTSLRDMERALAIYEVQ